MKRSSSPLPAVVTAALAALFLALALRARSDGDAPFAAVLVAASVVCGCAVVMARPRRDTLTREREAASEHEAESHGHTSTHGYGLTYPADASQPVTRDAPYPVEHRMGPSAPAFGLRPKPPRRESDEPPTTPLVEDPVDPHKTLDYEAPITTGRQLTPKEFAARRALTAKNYGYRPGAIGTSTLFSPDFTSIGIAMANPTYASVCAVACTRFRHGREVDHDVWLVRPPAPFDTFAPAQVALHGITEGLVTKQGRSLETALPEIMRFVGTDIVVSHNAVLDMANLEQACLAAKMPTPAIMFDDIRRLAVDRVGDTQEYTLAGLAHACAVERFAPDNPTDDARVTGEIMVRLLGWFT